MVYHDIYATIAMVYHDIYATVEVCHEIWVEQCTKKTNAVPVTILYETSMRWSSRMVIMLRKMCF
jgi:hypothetical protein